MDFFLRGALKYVLMATVFTPLLIIDFLPYPYNFSKVLAFNVLVELALVLFAASWFFSGRRVDLRKLRIKLRSNGLIIFLGVFFVSLVASALTAPNVFKAFWSTVERGDGLFGMLHLFAFLAMLLFTFRTDEDWGLFFRFALVGGAIAVFYGWLQFLGIGNVPFGIVPGSGAGSFIDGTVAFTPAARPGSFFENTAYFAIYSMFTAAIALLVFYQARKGGFWQIFSGVAAVLSGVMVFLPAARGPMIGFVLGAIFFFLVYAFKTKEGRVKKFSRGILLGVVALVLIFVATKNTGVWDKVPGLSRLSQLGFDDVSFKTRAIALGVSFQAFMEKPILGWGLEHYNVAYNKYYNPEYALYEEAWFDRAHNRLADVAVMQGLFGLISYLAIFVFVFYYIFFKKTGAEVDSNLGLPFGKFSPVLGALMTAYFINNLFIFETPVGYLLFFAILGFVLFKSGVLKDTEAIAGPVLNQTKVLLSGLGFAVVLIGVGYVFYNFNYVPLAQAKLYREIERSGNGTRLIEEAPNYLEPYNYLQPVLRTQFFQRASGGNNLRDRKYDVLTNVAIGALEEVAEKEVRYEPRHFINLAQAYNERGKDDPEFLKKSEEALRRALELTPKRQDVYYLLSYALSGQERYEEAINLAREAVALNDGVAKAHYNLGLELAFAGKENWPETEAEFGKALEIGFINQSLIKSDYANMEIVYKQMLSSFIPARDVAGVVRISDRLKQISDDDQIKTDLDTVIFLAREGNWAVLDELLEESAN